MNKVSFNIDDEVYDWIKKLAKKRNINIAEMLKLLVIKGLEKSTYSDLQVIGVETLRCTKHMSVILENVANSVNAKNENMVITDDDFNELLREMNIDPDRIGYGD